MEMVTLRASDSTVSSSSCKSHKCKTPMDNRPIRTQRLTGRTINICMYFKLFILKQLIIRRTPAHVLHWDHQYACVSMRLIGHKVSEWDDNHHFPPLVIFKLIFNLQWGTFNFENGMLRLFTMCNYYYYYTSRSKYGQLRPFWFLGYFYGVIKELIKAFLEIC